MSHSIIEHSTDSSLPFQGRRAEDLFCGLLKMSQIATNPFPTCHLTSSPITSWKPVSAESFALLPVDLLQLLLTGPETFQSSITCLHIPRRLGQLFRCLLRRLQRFPWLSNLCEPKPCAALSIVGCIPGHSWTEYVLCRTRQSKDII